MSVQNKTTLKSYFETGDKPTQSQFADLIDSMALVNETAAPETEHYRIIGADIPEESMEIIGILQKGDLDPKALGVAVTKFSNPSEESALLGGYFNGLRIVRSDIQENGDANIEYYMTGLTNDEVNLEHGNGAFLFHESETGIIKRIDWNIMVALIEIIASTRKHLKSVDYNLINDSPETSQVVIPLDSFILEQGQFVREIIIDSSAFDNISAISAAYITLPGSATTIDVLPYMQVAKNIAIPVNVIQDLLLTPTNLTLTLDFDMGSSEVNPKNFTTGYLSIGAVATKKSM